MKLKSGDRGGAKLSHQFPLHPNNWGTLITMTALGDAFVFAFLSTSLCKQVVLRSSRKHVYHPTFSPSLPLSGVTLLYISFPTEYTGQACDGKDPDNSRAWRSWAGERQGSGQNRCKCASPLTIPGGDKGPKGQLNMSVTHLAPNSEDTICSGPETPQGLTEELWGETGSQKDVHSRATALENGAGAALQTCCVKCWPLGKVSLSTFFSHWSCPGFS